MDNSRLAPSRVSLRFRSDLSFQGAWQTVQELGPGLREA